MRIPAYLMPIVLLTLVIVGCTSSDDRLVEMARENAAREAESQRQMADLEKQVAEGGLRSSGTQRRQPHRETGLKGIRLQGGQNTSEDIFLRNAMRKVQQLQQDLGLHIGSCPFCAQGWQAESCYVSQWDGRAEGGTAAEPGPREVIRSARESRGPAGRGGHRPKSRGRSSRVSPPVGQSNFGPSRTSGGSPRSRSIA